METREILDRALARAAEIGVPMSIAVVDAGGHLVVLERMTGAGFATPEIAWGKAWTAAAFGVSTAEIASRFSTAPSFAAAIATTSHGRFTPRQGALPLVSGGGIGASGGTSEQDEDVVRAGIG